MKTVVLAVIAAAILVGNSVSTHPGPSQNSHARAHKSHKVVHVAPVKQMPLDTVSVVVHGTQILGY